MHILIKILDQMILGFFNQLLIKIDIRVNEDICRFDYYSTFCCYKKIYLYFIHKLYFKLKLLFSRNIQELFINL